MEFIPFNFERYQTNMWDSISISPFPPIHSLVLFYLFLHTKSTLLSSASNFFVSSKMFAERPICAGEKKYQTHAPNHLFTFDSDECASLDVFILINPIKY